MKTTSSPTTPEAPTTPAPARLRRPARPRPEPSKYRHQTDTHAGAERAIDKCETDETTGGLHRVEVSVWPPRRKRGQIADDSVAHHCVYCGCVCVLYPDNKPEESGIDVVVLEPKR